MISGLRGRTYEEKCKEIGLDTLERRREDTDMIQTFKIITGADNVKKDTWFKMAAENAERVTRVTSDRTRLAVNRVKTDQRGHFFSQRVVEGWNKLPVATRDSTGDYYTSNGYHRREPRGLPDDQRTSTSTSK